MLHNVSWSEGQESFSRPPIAQATMGAGIPACPCPPSSAHWPRQPAGSCPGSRSPRGWRVGHGLPTGKPWSSVHTASAHTPAQGPSCHQGNGWGSPLPLFPMLPGPTTPLCMLGEWTPEEQVHAVKHNPRLSCCTGLVDEKSPPTP